MRASILDLFCFLHHSELCCQRQRTFHIQQWIISRRPVTERHEFLIISSYIVFILHHSELCCQRQKTYNFQQCIISGRALRPPTVPALTLIPGSIRPNMLVANIPFKFRPRYSLLKTFHFISSSSFSLKDILSKWRIADEAGSLLCLTNGTFS